MTYSATTITRRAGLSRLAWAALLLGVSFHAGRSVAETADNLPQAFTPAAFAAAQHAGKHILVETYATWCAVCARQTRALTEVLKEPKCKDLVTFRVDFDTQKDAMRKFNAQMQSTLIVFRGSKEIARSVGETQSEWIDDMLN